MKAVTSELPPPGDAWAAGRARPCRQDRQPPRRVYEREKLRFAGKVGTAFTDRERDRVGALLAELAIDKPPFDPPPPREVSRNS